MPPKIDFRKRQKGALVETSQPRPIRISAPGHILGKGPGQGRMEGEPTDEVQQYRQDMANAPPRLRVELTPPPPSSSERGRGTFRGGRGRGARGVRGGIAGRGRGGALGGGMPGPSRPAVPPTGPAAMSAGQPARQASAGPAFLNLGNSAGNSRIGAPSAGTSSYAGGRAPQPAIHPDRKPIIQSAQRQNAQAQSTPSKKLPDRPLADTPPANTTTYPPAPPEAPDTAPSRPYQPMGAYAKVMQNRIDRSIASAEPVAHTAERMVVEPATQTTNSASAGSFEASSSVASRPVTPAPTGKRAEKSTFTGARSDTPTSVGKRPETSTSTVTASTIPAPAGNQPDPSTSQPGASASTVSAVSTTARPKSKLKFKPNLTKPASKPPTATDRPAPAFITRGRDAYSPSEPVVPLPSESLSSDSSDEEPLAAGYRARSPTTPVEPAPDLDVEVLRSTRRIVDYTAQVKTEPGTAAMMASSIDEPEEEAVEDADDSEKQSSTLLILKSQRPDLADCWSRDVKVRIEARKAARIAVEKELENKSRRITSSMWRDDGYAVDWALISQGIVTYSYARELRPFEQPEHLRELVIAKRTAWEEEQLKQWDATYPDRTRGNIKRTSFKFSFEWHRRSATLDSTVLTGGPPTASSGQSSNPAKRVRSPSPETGRKSLKCSIDQAARTTCAPTPEIGLSEQPSTSYTAIEILYVEDQRAKSRVPVVHPRQYALGISARAAKADVKEWSQRCLPKITGKQAWHPADNNKAPENVRNAVRSFIQKLFQLESIREVHSLRTMYHPNCTISVLVQDVKGTSSIGRDLANSMTGIELLARRLFTFGSSK
ncbi:hypothetical protein HD553DRAFT_54305 [Filobasidium floriforme]|uniref:uncharacterized protein n=1 Tax=Filobasidium floriforme TaxID=5210 RepID=UPI001E8E460A|nr:uncharacterized protein HD553DRAFT_54305 [Filobasidium floriforme]KAH8083108.1 hypothetical protein HD553DRAFT_54305 [Filobasidium floriforme]